MSSHIWSCKQASDSSANQCFYGVARPGRTFTHTDLVKATSGKIFPIGRDGIIARRALDSEKQAQQVARIVAPRPEDPHAEVDHPDWPSFVQSQAYTTGDTRDDDKSDLRLVPPPSRKWQEEKYKQTHGVLPQDRIRPVSTTGGTSTYEPETDCLPLTHIVISTGRPFRTHKGGPSDLPYAEDDAEPPTRASSNAVWTMTQDLPSVPGGGVAFTVFTTNDALDISHSGPPGVLNREQLPDYMQGRLADSFEWREGSWAWRKETDTPRFTEVVDEPALGALDPQARDLVLSGRDHLFQRDGSLHDEVDPDVDASQEGQSAHGRTEMVDVAGASTHETSPVEESAHHTLMLPAPGTSPSAVAFFGRAAALVSQGAHEADDSESEADSNEREEEEGYKPNPETFKPPTHPMAPWLAARIKAITARQKKDLDNAKW